MTKITLLISLCFLLSACSKSKVDNRQRSVWKVGVDSFVTNNVSTATSKANTTGIGGNDSRGNGFGLYFMGDIREPRKYIITDSPYMTPFVIYADIYIGNKDYTYLNLDTVFVTATIDNGKGMFTLPTSWFKNKQDMTDSILVSGIFREP